MVVGAAVQSVPVNPVIYHVMCGIGYTYSGTATSSVSAPWLTLVVTEAAEKMLVEVLITPRKCLL